MNIDLKCRDKKGNYTYNLEMYYGVNTLKMYFRLHNSKYIFRPITWSMLWILPFKNLKYDNLGFFQHLMKVDEETKSVEEENK